jgi:hypothetical protein
MDMSLSICTQALKLGKHPDLVQVGRRLVTGCRCEGHSLVPPPCLITTWGYANWGSELTKKKKKKKKFACHSQLKARACPVLASIYASTRGLVPKSSAVNMITVWYSMAGKIEHVPINQIEFSTTATDRCIRPNSVANDQFAAEYSYEI